MYNKRSLSKDTKASKAPKSISKPKDIILDPMGQWKYPGQNTRIPGNDITMQGVNYPVLGVGSDGQKQMMYPGQDYKFQGADYVDEYPQMKKGGGLKSKKYSRDLEATNYLFHESPLFKKPKSKKKKIYHPKAKHYQEGGDAMNGMMKARLAYANEFGNPAAKRMINIPDNPYQFDNGDTGTHYMASMDNYAVPQIQDENGQLMLGDYGPDSNEAMRFDSDEDANYFAEHYKDVSPGFMEMELTPEEIQQYRDGGYVVEELPQAKKGGTSKRKKKESTEKPSEPIQVYNSKEEAFPLPTGSPINTQPTIKLDPNAVIDSFPTPTIKPYVYPAGDYADQAWAVQQQVFPQSINTVNDWYKNWYAGRMENPKFTDVATERYLAALNRSTPFILEADPEFSENHNALLAVTYKPKVLDPANESKKNQIFINNAVSPDAGYNDYYNERFIDPEYNDNYFVREGIHEKSHWDENNFKQPGTDPYWVDKDVVLKDILPKSKYNKNATIYNENRTDENPYFFNTDFKGGLNEDSIDYLSLPTEIRARLNVWRQLNNIDPTKNYSVEELQKIMDQNIEDGYEVNEGDYRNIIELYHILQGDPKVLKTLNDEFVQNDNSAGDQLNMAKKGGSLLTKKVTCKKCGWKWDAADGGNDLTTCHKCGGKGLIHAQTGGSQIYKYADRPEASYKKDAKGNWLISLPSTKGEYVPIKDPTGKRAGELNEKAKPLTFKMPDIVSAEEKYHDGPLQSADWLWSLPIALPAVSQFAAGAGAMSLPGMSSVPGATLGNLVNSGFIANSLLKAPGNAKQWYDVSQGKKDWKDAALGSAEIAAGLFGSGSGFKSLAQDVKAVGKNVSQLPNKIATGNSALPIAWKVEKPMNPIKSSDYIKRKYTDEEIELLDKYGKGMWGLTPEDWVKMEKLTKSGATDFSKGDYPISRVLGYYKRGSQENEIIKNLKRGDVFKTPTEESIRTWTAGVPKGGFPGGSDTRLIIPSRYTKNLGSNFSAMPYYDKRLDFIYNPNGTLRNYNAVLEKELMGNIPGGFKVIGKTANDGKQTLFIKPHNSKKGPLSFLGLKEGGMTMGQEVDLTPEQEAYLRKLGYKLERI